MSSRPELRLRDAGTGDALRLRPDVIVAGYTGRDASAVEAHIAELEAHGVPRPDAVPAFYEVPPSRLVTSPTTIETTVHTSGEVEPVLVVSAAGWWVGLGSDHTDR